MTADTGPMTTTTRVVVLVAILILGSVLVAYAQPPAECALPAAGEPNVTNPTRVCFEVSPDHDTIDGYALDLVRDDGSIAQTIDMAKPTPVLTGDGTRWVSWPNLNVMPRAFGEYTSYVRAYGGGVSGPDSTVSNTWDRSPGPPSSAPRIVEVVPPLPRYPAN